MGQGAPPARAPDQYRRLTHAHAAATGVTRQGAPAPNLSTASNGPSETGDDERHASTTVHFPLRPAIARPRQKTPAARDPHRPTAQGTQLSHPTAAPRSGEWILTWSTPVAGPDATPTAGADPFITI